VTGSIVFHIHYAGWARRDEYRVGDFISVGNDRESMSGIFKTDATKIVKVLVRLENQDSKRIKSYIDHQRGKPN
jgi:hypothetical protein